jgi:hypothetical protein
MVDTHLLFDIDASNHSIYSLQKHNSNIQLCCDDIYTYKITNHVLDEIDPTI